MTVRRNALGRGLEALLPGSAPLPEAAPVPASSAAEELPIERIRPNPDQPRRQFDEAELERLADSIRRHGVLQPVVVRRSADGEYELVVGERRWRAAQRAGRATLPVVVADVEPRERLELALVENVQRQDLNPIELAYAFRALAEGGATQEEVGGRLGLDRSTVANHLRLLELARSLQEDVERGRLSVGHAKALLQVANPERRLHLRDAVLREGLSVRETEHRARSAALRPPRSRKDGRPASLDADTRAWVDRLRSRLQTQVRIVGSAKRGRIEIEYFSGEDLERLVSLLEAGA